MIVQCEACQTRFRLADEKVKPGGTKVRCSKCKVVFTVTLPEPEPVEEAVDFGSFNMEKVSDDTSTGAEQASASLPSDTPEPEEQTAPPSKAEPESDSTSEATESAESSDLDFSALESEMESTHGLNEELADEFSFADTSRTKEDIAVGEDTASSDFDFSIDEESQAEKTDVTPTDFDAVFEVTKEPDGSGEIDFSDKPDSESGFELESRESTEIDFSTEESTEPAKFSFDSPDKEPKEQEAPGEFPFDGEEDDAFSFDETEKETPSTTNIESSGPGEFSFDDDNTSGEESTSAWGDESSTEDSFSFDEPEFDTDNSPTDSPASNVEEGGLQFGEIDFSSDGGEDEITGVDDFSSASMEEKGESESLSLSQKSSPSPARDFDDEQLSPPPPPAKKSSLSRILLLLVLLLVILGGAVGFLFVKEGSLNLNTVAQYLPFLQEYIGEAPESSPGDRIGINITGSSYVNGQAGQMLIIQGAAVNNHPTARSAITVKGVLLDDTGKPLLQQTVFCGNKIEDAALQSLTFAAIEEAMNNQFGDSLSNMNVAAGATIPFTIVFRNLPEGIANINVEVVDSKPGAG